MIAGLVLSVDCDQHPRRALVTLSAIIGPPTVIVRSGGQWTDPETGEVHDKLHLHWRLVHPARGDDLPKLKQARALATRIVGGDASNIPVCHPIRWPGSWHRKGEPVLCEIEDADRDREIDLSIALDLLKAAAPAPQPGDDLDGVEHEAGDEPQASPELIAAALAVVPNDDVVWVKWNRVGMATSHATSGVEPGFDAFDIWSKKSKKYDATATRERWMHYSDSPPERIGAGTIIHLANHHAPGWRDNLQLFQPAADAPSIVPAQEAIGDKPRSRPRNDIITEDSAAVEFVEENVDKLRYCHSTGSWFQWDGNIWRREDTQLAFHWARLLARRLGENEDKKARGAIGKTAFASGVEKFAQRDRDMAVTVAYWDQDQWLLGTPAGTVDLRTGKLRPSDPTDGITKSTLVAPADTGRVLWMKFLGETTGGDAGLIRFLQQWLGYCLTGSTREHALIFLYGGGGNGKGVFLNTTARIFGDYAATAAMDTFAVSKNERHPTDLAMLRGARIVTASETEEGRAWAEARIKALTGGDKISARFMRQDFFEYYPQFKLTIIGNHKPVLRTVDDAMRRRINMIPFLLKPPVIDRQLEDKLLTEAPGILQWMIDGCLDWQANGLIRPAVVQAATSAYFSEQDLFGHWIEECCDVALGRNPPIWGLSGSLFASWAEYCRKANEAPGTQKAFAGKMIQRSFEPYRVPGTGSRAFKFIRLKNAPPTEAGVTRDTL